MNDVENDRQFAQLKMIASHSDDKYFCVVIRFVKSLKSGEIGD